MNWLHESEHRAGARAEAALSTQQVVYPAGDLSPVSLFKRLRTIGINHKACPIARRIAQRDERRYAGGEQKSELFVAVQPSFQTEFDIRDRTTA